MTIEYDALGMAVAIEDPGGGFANRLRWDREGRLVERIRGDLAMRWTCDERNAVDYRHGSETLNTVDAGGYVVVRYPALGTVDDRYGRLVAAHADGMQVTWRCEDGDLVGYELRAGDRHRTATATLRRDSVSRVVSTSMDGAEHEYACDAAVQLASAADPDGRREVRYAYDGAGGRLLEADKWSAAPRRDGSKGRQKQAESGVQLGATQKARRRRYSAPEERTQIYYDNGSRMDGTKTRAATVTRRVSPATPSGGMF